MDRGEDQPTRSVGPLGGKDPDAGESVDWEIEHYLAERMDRLVVEGWDPEAAREEAERRFGPMERYRPRLARIERRRVRMETMGRWVDFVGGAVAGTFRTVRRSPGFALGVVLTLGLGLGANAAMFGIVDRLLLRPPDGITNPDEVRLVGLTRVFGSRPPSTQFALTWPDLVDLEEHNGLAGVAGFAFERDVTVGSGPEASSATARLVTWDFLDVLGVEPAIGRFPTAEEDQIGAPGTVVLAWGYWQSRYGGDVGVLGRTFEIGGHPHTVIGVTPRGVTGVTLSPVDLWLPIETAQAALTGQTNWRESRQAWWVQAVARLAPDGSWEAAEEQATRLYLNAGGDETFQARREAETSSIEFRGLTTAADSDEGQVVRWLAGVSVIVLLIACANVANLFLARAARRRREVAVRLAMGVPRRRLVGQMGLEAVLLAMLGGGVALALAGWGGEALRRVLLPEVLFTDPVSVRVLVFTAAVSVLAGLLAGLGPALQATRVDLAGAMGEGGRGSSAGRSRIRGALVVAQTALSVVLLVGAGLFVKSLDTVNSLDLGIDVDRLLLATLEPAGEELSAREQTAIYEDAAQRANALPGVEAVGLTQSPLGWGFATRLRVPGLDSIPRMPGGGPYYWSVDSGYFGAAGLRIEEGRGFEPSDAEGAAPVAVVGRTMADSLWQGAALGQCLIVGAPTDGEDPPCTTVVGVVEDAARSGFQDDPFFGYYLSLSQRPETDRANAMYVRTAGDPAELSGPLALALRSFSSDVRFARVETLREVLDPQARSWSLGARMFTLFGALAILVAAIGLYSLLAFDVSERRRELGIRMALGAATGRLLRQVVGSAFRLVAAGVILGLGAAWLLAPRVEELLFQVAPRDPAVLGGVAVLLVLVGLTASLLPARRATRVDPMEALRAE